MLKLLILLVSVFSFVHGQCTTPYTVNWGDTCNTIADKAGISFTTFIALNKPISCSSLQFGQQLCLARVGFSPYPRVACTSKYTTLWGETCDSMVLNSKTPLSTILAFNPGLDCTALQTGQLICLDNTAPLVCTTPYSVQWGDTCLGIADKAGISFTTFIALNKPIACSTLQYGQQLCLAKQGFTPYPKVACTNKYSVQAGETCDMMALNSRTALSTILALNPGLDCTALQTGQPICLDNAAPLVCTAPYTVQWGDTCNLISSKAGISFTTLLALNKVIFISYIYFFIYSEYFFFN